MSNTDEKKDLKNQFKNCKVICVMGGPCSGKRNFAMKIAEEFNFTYLSAGDILRNEITKVSY